MSTSPSISTSTYPNHEFNRWREACQNLLSKQQQQRSSSSNPQSLFNSTRSSNSLLSNRFPSIHSVSESTTALIPSVEQANDYDSWTRMSEREETKQERSGRERCEQWRDELIRTSPMIRFMTRQLALVSCDPLSPSSSSPYDSTPKIRIMTCPPTICGGFGPPLPGQPISESEILICSNGIMDKGHLQDTLAHEMIHWWDQCRFKVDWTNLRHHACSEIRAASLSGDCRIGREYQRKFYGFSKQHQVCTRRRAIASVVDNLSCPDRETAERVVDEVWSSCFNDTRPFDEIY